MCRNGEPERNTTVPITSDRNCSDAPEIPLAIKKQNNDKAKHKDQDHNIKSNRSEKGNILLNEDPKTGPAEIATGEALTNGTMQVKPTYDEPECKQQDPMDSDEQGAVTQGEVRLKNIRKDKKRTGNERK
jgi:hypothetical protein